MKLKDFLLTQLQRPLVQRALHTFWQAVVGVLVAGIFAAHSSADIQALIIAAAAAGASAVKTMLVAYAEGRRV